MQPNLTWQLAKIRQTEALEEAVQRQAFRSVKDDSPNWPGPRLTIAFATSMLIVIPLVWIFAAR
jgi:hypothetical protein